jgi:type I restriction enzyme, S subunit
MTGALPESWDECDLRSLAEVVSKGTTPTSIGRSFTRDGVRFLKIEAITDDGRIRVDRLAHIDEETNRLLARSRLQEGDIVISIAGALGRTALISAELLPCNTNQALAFIRLREKDDDLRRWVLAYLRTPAIQNHLMAISVQGAQANLSLENIRDLRIAIPTRPEYRGIVAVLDSADELLTELDELLIKKRAIRTGAMQHLLNGRSRLPGFDDPWKRVLLGEHVAFLKTASFSRAQMTDAGTIACLHYGDIHAAPNVRLDMRPSGLPGVTRAEAKRYPALEVGDLVFVDASEDAAGVGKSVEITGVPAAGAIAGLHTIAARFDSAILADGFKGYLQFVPEFRSAVVRLAAGLKVLATSKSHIAGIEMALPSPDEQSAIASILSDMDAEIEALEARRAKAALIKRGMAQALLTGRTRLPLDGRPEGDDPEPNQPAELAA